jgi:hypothetical protein
MLGTARAGGPASVPRIIEPWWQVAGDPDLGPWTSPQQQPVDFAIWPARDGRWQLWSCIRKTKCGGNTRLFHRWEFNSLTEPNWTPGGIAMTADPNLGETSGGLQAPHVIREGETYFMFYGDWRNICLASSRDGKSFERVRGANGRPQLFSEDRQANEITNTRDAMVLRVGNLWHCYYTAYPDRKGAVYARTSSDLKTWSKSKIVSSGGSAGDNPYSAECPFVVHRPETGDYYLSRTQRYGEKNESTIYCSKDPLDFGVNDDRYLLCRLPVAAPEFICQNGKWYIACLLPSLKGIRIARLEWSRD